MPGTETYPVTISQPPAMISGYRVLAWAEIQHIRGNYPGGIVLAVSNPEYSRPEYVTWDAYTKDGGQAWHACSGHYITDHKQAWDDFTDRCRHARLARMF